MALNKNAPAVEAEASKFKTCFTDDNSISNTLFYLLYFSIYQKLSELLIFLMAK